MKFNEIYRGLATQMFSEFENISSQFSHNGLKGSERELIVKKFLELYLPKKYALSSGEIIDAEKNTSKQCDIVIYDHLNCPLILNGNDFNIFPCEAVLSQIEVKSRLGVREIDDAINKTRSIKNLSRSCGRIGSVLFSFTSEYSCDPMEKITDVLVDRYKRLDSKSYIDIVCILDAGIITVNGDNVIPNPNDLPMFMFTYSDLKVPILLWFYWNLLNLLSVQKTETPNYLMYFDDFEIGLVRRTQFADQKTS